MLGKHIDPPLDSSRFKRARSSMQYKRAFNDARQSINIAYTKQKYQDSISLAYIHPNISVEMPAISEVLLAMSKNTSSIKNCSITIFQTVGVLGQTRSLIDWRPVSEDDFSTIGESLSRFLISTVVPFLDTYVTPMDIITGFESNDDRLPRGIDWLMRAIAAYIVVGNIDEANKLVVEHIYSKAGIRHNYREIIEYVTNLVS